MMFKWLGFLIFTFLISFLVACYFFVIELSKELPDISRLDNIQYQMPLRIYSQDNLLIGQFGEKRRLPLTINDVPQQQLNAFLAAEDEHFFTHPGVDYKGLLRAAHHLILTGKKKQGGSTITMQVARNFLLSKEKTFLRKLKEILLALQIEKRYSKTQILELYLNKIYMGQRAYGIAAAAQAYYGKPLNDLNLQQQAMIAGLPKAPSIYNPIANSKRATQRRNYVLRRMLELKFIDSAEYKQAIASIDDAHSQSIGIELKAPFAAELARQELVDKYGDDAYSLGLNVYTTLTKQLQTAADRSLHNALHLYDERHEYRGLPHKKFKSGQPLSSLQSFGDSQQAIVSALSDDGIQCKLSDSSFIDIPWSNIPWQKLRPPRVSPPLIQSQDVIWVRQLKDQSWALTQIPAAEAAFVALDTHNGAILAISGGFDFNRSRFNRATQSKRQPGSGFKPFIYTAALEKGFTPASIINDAPIIIEDPSQKNDWRPENYTRRFLGPIPLRVALRKSVNLVSIRLLQEIGIPYAIETARRFGFEQDQLPTTPSLALGSGSAPPLKMASAYAVFANGGFLIQPYLIERIEDHTGNILFQANPATACRLCDNSESIDNPAPRIISASTHFLMNSLLHDVVQRGTATQAKQLGRSDLAGKTGTTNEQRDAWFNGFNQNIAASAWVGFDNLHPLGKGETGGKAALPMWIDFMRTALENTPELSLTPPPGIVQAFINPDDGLLTDRGNPNGIWEYFTKETAPTLYSAPKQPLPDFDETWLQESLF